MVGPLTAYAQAAGFKWPDPGHSTRKSQVQIYLLNYAAEVSSDKALHPHCLVPLEDLKKVCPVIAYSQTACF